MHAVTKQEKQQTTQPSQKSENGVTDLGQQVESLLREWAPHLGLAGWTIDFSLDEDKFLATAESQPRYRTIQLTFNPTRIQKENANLEELVIHELVHALSWRLWKLSEKFVELHTQTNTHEVWDWVLEEIHEEFVTIIGEALVEAKAICPDGSFADNDEPTNLELESNT